MSEAWANPATLQLRAWPWWLAITVVVAGLYASSLTGGFINDDWAMIAGNGERMRGLAALERFFTAGVWESSTLGQRDVSIYRPVWLLWNFAQYNLFGEDPFYWRLANLALHIVNTLLFAAILAALLPALTRLEQALGALIFACHPAKAQSVAWISGSTDLLLGFFFLSAVLLFLKFRRTGNRWALAGTAVCYCGAVLSKEPGIVLPVLLLTIDLWSGAAARGGRGTRMWGEAWVAIYGMFGAIAAALLTVRNLVLGGALHGGVSFGLSGEQLSRLVEYGLGYLGLLVLPWPVPYFFRHVDESIAGPWAFIAGAVVLAALTVALWRGRVARVGVIWLCVTLAAPLALALHEYGLFGPRYLYLPSAGAVIAGCAGYLWLKPRLARAAPVFATAVLAAFAGLTAIELPTWRDELTWAARVIESAPSSHYGWISMAQHYERLGQPEKAIETYRRGTETVPPGIGQAKLLERLAVFEAERGRFDASLALYREVSMIPGSEASGFIGMGNNYWVMRRYPEALAAYDKALDFAPESPLALYNRARLSEAAGDTTAALEHYRRFLERPPASNLAEARRHARTFVERWGGS